MRGRSSGYGIVSALSAFLVVAMSVHAVCLNGHFSVAAEFKSAKAVVMATVLSERLILSPDKEFYDGTLYRIRVDKAYRGDPGKQVRIFSENSSGRFPMTVGVKYLLFIHTERGQMQVDYCGNSGPVSERGKELQQVERLTAAK